jgi:CheY-like chemotaxis protein
MENRIAWCGPVHKIAAMSDKQPLVLVVEDNLIVALGMKAQLEAVGLHAAMAASVEEATAFLARSKPAAAVVDLNLREPLDGLLAARRLVAEGVRVVFCSGYEQPPMDPPIDFSAYLRKPCDPDDLVRAVRKALGRA